MSDGGLDGIVRDVMNLGGVREALVAVGERMELRLRTASDVAVGTRVRVGLPPGALTVWPDGDDAQTDVAFRGPGAR